MKKVSQNRKELLLKFATIAISVMIVIPSIVMFESVLPRNSGETADTNRIENLIPEKPPQVKSVLTEDGTWVKVADGLPGTPVEVYVAVSDTTGLTIVSDCHGFWRGSDNITSLNTIFMPGASIITDWGRPMLPRIIRYVEVPHDIDITLDIIYGEPTPLPFYDIIPAPRQIGPTDNHTIYPSMFF